jgi:hypothetical protein
MYRGLVDGLSYQAKRWQLLYAQASRGTRPVARKSDDALMNGLQHNIRSRLRLEYQ